MEKSFFEEKVNYNGISALDEVKSYTHFDAKISMKKCWDYISDPKKVATHSFFPFIRFEQVFEKYVLKDKKNDEREKKFKTREICYASHIDGCIYTYYAAELNEKYNQALLDAGIDNVKSGGTRHSSVVAYRDVLEGQSNINFAHDAIQFIRQIKDCMVIIGDFKSFFDRLNHAYLKKQIKNILQVEELSEDWYAVFKSITKYSYVDLSQLMFRLCVAGGSSFKELYIEKIEHKSFNDWKCKCLEGRDAVACGQADYKNIQKFAGANKIVKNGETIGYIIPDIIEDTLCDMLADCCGIARHNKYVSASYPVAFKQKIKNHIQDLFSLGKTNYENNELFYSLYYLPNNIFKIWVPLTDLLYRKLLKTNMCALELGAGPGTSTFGLLEFYREMALINPQQIYRIEIDIVNNRF